jgi:transcription-repair coupling factor (superfamily II helicase)
VEFKDLGLLVIDEEQRFGVAQKEKIKTMKTEVDVLTLSATPIPRTLYMAMSGVREMSLITTPPPSRRSIMTHLSRYNLELVRAAIRQELDRGGQIFCRALTTLKKSRHASMKCCHRYAWRSPMDRCPNQN